MKYQCQDLVSRLVIQSILSIVTLLVDVSGTVFTSGGAAHDEDGKQQFEVVKDV